MSDIDVVPYNAALLTDWEIDALFRIRTVEQITSSKLTLSSLIQLLDQISNIVITSQVGDAVLSAVQHAEHTQSALDLSDLGSALTLSREAFNQSEAAFTHPSLLALLYFPDDQKYAVYIPLFLPVMIPVILSLHAIIDWVKKKLPENVLQHIQLPCIPDQTQLYDNADEKED
ncbi:GPI transamidase component PIG-S-like [Diaphorina citri]|uniref:GPI transamidase component PIG-S-like n=1 Tax=Diaphorina citri TaxID=121845 RepID=A0A3Q0IZM1_DIACI|nr:GPI transamidase component PIG-S-like [Diaphorina citri]